MSNSKTNWSSLLIGFALVLAVLLAGCLTCQYMEDRRHEKVRQDKIECIKACGQNIDCKNLCEKL
jgi:hypothetical protein